MSPTLGANDSRRENTPAPEAMSHTYSNGFKQFQPSIAQALR